MNEQPVAKDQQCRILKACSAAKVIVQVLIIFIYISLTSACSNLYSYEQTILPRPVTSPTYQESLDEPVSEVIETPEVESPVVLRIWLPPQFDPASPTPAGKILKDRLAEFSSRRPELRVEVRIKSESGPGGLLSSLESANAAAPDALPDLVALPYNLLDPLAQKGILYPYKHMSEAINEPDWYPYALELAKRNENVFGLPFAGDALALIYRPQSVSTPPLKWSDVIQAGIPLVFPAANPQSLVTVSDYQANQGKIINEQNQPTLESSALAEVLTYYLNAKKSGIMPVWLTQYQSDEQAWDAYRDGLADMLISWVSKYLSIISDEDKLSTIPTPQGNPSTLATGWVWALASREENRQRLTTELANFLVDSRFLGELSQAAGYLPVRPSSFEHWPNTSTRVVLGQIARSARVIPSSEILSRTGPPIQKAITDVFSGKIYPIRAAQIAADSITSP